ncbi:UNVERIFIED_CONTAM: Adenylate isopentenyltransferase 3, chloroplastic [Sesamum radiatum]|uniref:Adenylate isopentenyltransferase 3, chloroplastic n=1 Tax=Sesamum radiatum TaxID=300843 RepID=A0AAW2USR8_SESRA
MGATGTGKSRLSVDLATRLSAEIINSDKMQVYHGLDIVTNKITDEERCGVPHHLLGVVDPESDFSAANFRTMASISMRSILSRGQLPMIVGGSNSFIEALADMNFRSKYECFSSGWTWQCLYLIPSYLIASIRWWRGGWWMKFGTFTSQMPIIRGGSGERSESPSSTNFSESNHFATRKLGQGF